MWLASEAGVLAAGPPSIVMIMAAALPMIAITPIRAAMPVRKRTSSSHA